MNNIFIFMGFDYCYVEDGNDLVIMIEVFWGVKDVDYLVVLYVYILKGKGFKLVEEEKMCYYWCSFFNLKMGVDF